MNEILNQIIDVFNHLERRPKMFFAGDEKNYENYESYCLGLFYGIKSFSNVDIDREILKWYLNEEELQSTGIIGYLRYEFREENIIENSIKTQRLLTIIIKFFKENKVVLDVESQQNYIIKR